MIFTHKPTDGLLPRGLCSNKDYILDEAIKYFKANVFFKSFSPENDADRLFIYVTLWIQGSSISILTSIKPF